MTEIKTLEENGTDKEEDIDTEESGIVITKSLADVAKLDLSEEHR
eukprot:CAMPEP_0194361018 /NCGR_PEP_ID=MMETSP0174-20130528/8517_1 /TAXON_ID=216777 /ORGANISM="Proboscia alata, Strain PI-D3" /LENGTH=44 /DNA_ID= /DNA_START= /DNA_END= /DNA_ORIENTATION=